MIVPQTRQEAIYLYNERAKSKKKKTKYDMFLGGLICCSDKEFNYAKRTLNTNDNWIPCYMCLYLHINCDGVLCRAAGEKTLSMSWNGGAIG